MIRLRISFFISTLILACVCARTTAGPWETTTAGPWETTTGAPWEPTTEAPWETTTGAPWETTTEAPWETTTFFFFYWTDGYGDPYTV